MSQSDNARNQEKQDEQATTPEEIFKQYETSPEGLNPDEAAKRLERYGPNQLQEEEVSALRKFLGYFWGPIPWMIEVAALLSAIVGHWADLIIILVLLAFNAGVGFYQEYNAGNAIDQLKKSLALKARVRRGGEWKQIDATELVPGDVVRLRLGDIVPADVALTEGEYLNIDQSALTGESLPVEKNQGESAYSGSVIKQGEMVGVVSATGGNTYFGKTARLVGEAHTTSHFQRAVLNIGDYLIYMTLGLVAILVLVELHRHHSLLEVAQFALILTVAAIPVAMPAVLSVTMAIGAVALSRMKAIVARLESIEEMAGMDILCSDKTGTLTENELTLGDPAPYGDTSIEQLIAAAALASKEEDADPIDLAVIAGVKDKQTLSDYTVEDFKPFDPVVKHTEASVTDKDGHRFTMVKGAPQVVRDLCGEENELVSWVNERVDDLAGRGFRTLGVARQPEGGSWAFLGLLPLYDPPREDAADTIKAATEHGIDVRMVTGDNVAIAKEIAGELGLRKDILDADRIPAAESGDQEVAPETARLIEEADGFAQVFPEHKFAIVKALQDRDHLVGMTGDGVNDAPALSQADVGIAVSGATDAARSAADLVLTAPGLSVIVRAVEEARRIFERMNSYAIYRITETIRIMIFVVLAMLVYDFYPITAIMIILLALLNDLPIMAIAYDNTWLDPRPVRWNMRRVLTVSTSLGLVGVVETFALLSFFKVWLDVDAAHLQSVIFLKLALAGHLTLLVARTRKPFWSKPGPNPILLGAIIGTQTVAVLIVSVGIFVPAIPWTYIVGVIAYCLAWMFIEDMVKITVYKQLGLAGKHHQRFMGVLGGPLHSHGKRREER